MSGKSSRAGSAEPMSDEDRSYWNHLGSIGIQNVLAEGDRVRSERDSVAAGTRSLAFDHYRTFIATSDCGRDAARHLEDGRHHAERLAEKLPPLRESCLSFEAECKTLSARRKSTSLVLSRHTKLLEVLELPQLVETCVRNGHYEEALELRQYAARIDKKLGHIPIVAEVVKTVQQSAKVMLNQLLAQLRAPIQLPACLKVVGYLRRMDAFGETEVRLRFLQARDSWLTSVLKSVPRDDPYDHISRTMELTRVHLFDIVTQYRALFCDEDPLIGSHGVQFHSSHRLLFSSWLERKIADFLATLQSDLQRGAKRQSLDSLMGQAMYFGQSFGRIGADFRLALVPIFYEAVRDVALEQLQGAEVKFKVGIDQLALKANVTSNDALHKHEISVTGGEIMDPHQPPLVLLDYPPLAELCNAILSSLNEIRLMPPVALAPEMIRRVQTILESAAQTLADREVRFGKTSIETERVTFQKLVTAFCQDMVPFIDRCLRKVFPPSELTTATSNATFALDTTKINTKLPLKHIVLAPRKSCVLPQEEEEEAEIKQETKEESAYVVDRANVIAQELKESVQDDDHASSNND